jgi:4'-phosphopantetheinyl transferase
VEEHVGVRVHIVALDVSPGERRRCAVLLSEAERARAATFRFAADRDRYVVGRGMLRRILARYGAGAPERLVIADAAGGKPALRPPSALRFNVANSGDRALVAVAHGREIGVDLEPVRAHADGMALARRVCAPAELAELAAVSMRHRSRALLRCWVRKEACVKALGIGLRQPLESFEVGVEPAAGAGVRTVRLPTVDAGTAVVAVVDVALGPLWVAALAVEVDAHAALLRSPLSYGLR